MRCSELTQCLLVIFLWYSKAPFFSKSSSGFSQFCRSGSLQFCILAPWEGEMDIERHEWTGEGKQCVWMSGVCRYNSVMVDNSPSGKS